MTLIEVMIVLTLLVLVAAVTIPILTGAIATQRLRRAGDQLRAEWTALRMQAVNEGRILVFRAELGGDTLHIDTVLDPHFTATLSIEARYDETGRLRRDTLTDDELSANDDGTMMRAADSSLLDSRTRLVTLPPSVFTADVIALTDDRTAFVLGATLARGLDPENSLQYEAVANSEVRFGEGSGSDGKTWSTPILFFPDGSTTTAAVLLKGDSGRCLEVRLRGLTGATTLCPITRAEEYIGELNATTTRL